MLALLTPPFRAARPSNIPVFTRVPISTCFVISKKRQGTPEVSYFDRNRARNGSTGWPGKRKNAVVPKRVWVAETLVCVSRNAPTSVRSLPRPVAPRPLANRMIGSPSCLRQGDARVFEKYLQM